MTEVAEVVTLQQMILHFLVPPIIEQYTRVGQMEGRPLESDGRKTSYKEVLVW